MISLALGDCGPPKACLDKAISVAARSGDRAALARCVARGANLNGYDELGRTPLIAAAIAGHVEIVRVLVRSGADLNLSDQSAGETAMSWAACMGHHEIVVLLIKSGASVDPTSGNFQYSPLMHAAINGHCATAKALLDAGADVHLKSASGSTALTLAERNGNAPIRDCILRRR